MGVAAYNRASMVIRERIAADDRPVEFDMMDQLNALPKYPDAGIAREPLMLTPAHNGWWVETQRLGAGGFGFWYRTIQEAVRRWSVIITEYDGTAWRGIPNDRLDGQEGSE